ncbi:MAG: hypothetical protein ACP5IB_06675 [Thermoplasmata archaeon]
MENEVVNISKKDLDEIKEKLKKLEEGIDDVYNRIGRSTNITLVFIILTITLSAVQLKLLSCLMGDINLMNNANMIITVSIIILVVFLVFAILDVLTFLIEKRTKKE